MNLFAYPLLIFLLTLVCYALYLLYLKHLNRLLKMISAENRSINPSAVWILGLLLLNLSSVLPLDFVVPRLIPYLFGVLLIVYQFYIVSKTADSIKEEFIGRNIEVDNRPTFALGLWMCLLDLVYHTLAYLNYTMYWMVAYVGFIICFIVYWVEINKITAELKSTPRLVSNEDSIFNGL